MSLETPRGPGSGLRSAVGVRHQVITRLREATRYVTCQLVGQARSGFRLAGRDLHMVALRFQLLPGSTFASLSLCC